MLFVVCRFEIVDFFVSGWRDPFRKKETIDQMEKDERAMHSECTAHFNGIMVDKRRIE